MRIAFLILFFVLLPIIGNADQIQDILDQQYIENVTQIPESINLLPDKNWQPSMDYFKENCKRKYSPYFISGYIDIVGFERSAKINGTFYIAESAEDAAIIRYETQVCALGYPRYKGGWKYDLKTYQEGNQYIAKLTATAILYYYYGANKYYDNITGVFYDSEPVPQRLDNIPQDIKVMVRQRNFTIINTTDISVEINNTIYDRYLVRTNYGYFEKINRIWHLEKTSKGVYFANETKINTFRSNNLSHTQNIIPVTDLNFNVTASGFFIPIQKVTNLITISYNSDPVAQFMNLDLIGFLTVFFTLTFFVYLKVKHL